MLHDIQEKPTHHSVKTGDDGILTINGKPHGKKSSIDDLVQYLGAWLHWYVGDGRCKKYTPHNQNHPT